MSRARLASQESGSELLMYVSSLQQKVKRDGGMQLWIWCRLHPDPPRCLSLGQGNRERVALPSSPWLRVCLISLVKRVRIGGIVLSEKGSFHSVH